MSFGTSPCFTAFVTALLAGAAPAALAASTELESVSSAGGRQNGDTDGPLAVSGDGRIVLFSSSATNLVPGAGDGDARVLYVRDRQAGTTSLAVVNPAGEPGDAADASDPVVSRDGRIIAFGSAASNLGGGGAPGTFASYLRDLRTNTVKPAVVASGGGRPNAGVRVTSLSAEGRFVVFTSDATNLDPRVTRRSDKNNVYVRDRREGTLTLESVDRNGGVADPAGGSGSSDGRITPDGRHLVFGSTASDLVAGDTNRDDVFLRDRTRGRTRLVSVAAGGGPANGRNSNPFVSDDGNTVAFSSSASNLVPGDTNNEYDVFVRDMAAGTTTRVSLAQGGAQGNGDSFVAGLSADGRYVLIESEAANLVPDDTNAATDIFLHDRRTGRTTRVSVRTAGGQANGYSLAGELSADGSAAVFWSGATNLVPGDDNGNSDLFARVLRDPG